MGPLTSAPLSAAWAPELINDHPSPAPNSFPALGVRAMPGVRVVPKTAALQDKQDSQERPDELPEQMASLVELQSSLGFKQYGPGTLVMAVLVTWLSVLLRWQEVSSNADVE